LTLILLVPKEFDEQKKNRATNTKERQRERQARVAWSIDGKEAQRDTAA
jgi:hypothetical protein